MKTLHCKVLHFFILHHEKEYIAGLLQNILNICFSQMYHKSLNSDTIFIIVVFSKDTLWYLTMNLEVHK